MKKILTLLLIIMVLFSMVSCNEGNQVPFNDTTGIASNGNKENSTKECITTTTDDFASTSYTTEKQTNHISAPTSTAMTTSTGKKNKKTTTNNIFATTSSTFSFPDRTYAVTHVLPEDETLIRYLQSRFRGGIEKIDCSGMGKVVDVQFCNTGIYAITENGELYFILKEKLFPNNKPYRKISCSITFSRFLGMSNGKTGVFSVLDENGEWYLFNPNDESFSCIKGVEDISPKLFGISSFSDKQIEKVEEFLQFSGDRKTVFYNFRHHSTEGVYNQYDSLFVTGSNMHFMTNGDLACSLLYNDRPEKITSTTIKTNKRWYVLQEIISNQEEYDKYVGVEPKYELTLTPIELDSRIIFYQSISSDTDKFIIVDKEGVLYHNLKYVMC